MPVVRIDGTAVGAPDRPVLYLHGSGPYTLELTWPDGRVGNVVAAQIESTPEPGADWPEHALPAHRGNRRVIIGELSMTRAAPVLGADE